MPSHAEESAVLSQRSSCQMRDSGDLQRPINFFLPIRSKERLQCAEKRFLFAV